MQKQQIVFHINNMAYTVNIDEEIKMALTKYLDLNSNNDTKDLLKAYIELSYEYKEFRKKFDDTIKEYKDFKKEVEDITNKISGF